MSEASDQGHDLIRRAPGGYLWNQAFSLWLFLSLFLYQLVITRLLPTDQKGVYELLLTPANFAVYLAALGLESAGSVYLPRALTEGGPGEAMAVALRAVGVRLVAVMVVASAAIWGLPLAAGALALLRLPGSTSLVQSLSHPELYTHRLALAAYVIGVGLSNLLAALLTALLRTRAVFVVGSLAQLLSVGLAYLLVGPLHGGADGALAALSIPGALMAIVYAVALWRVLPVRPTTYGVRELGRMLWLGVSAWMADLANGSLIKLIALAQLGVVVTHTQIAFFGVAYEMGHAAAFLFVAGLGGVGLAVMAAAYANHHLPHLAIAWRTVSKLQVLLAVPLVAFCVPHADAIIQVLYGQRYASVGPLLALFLTLNALVRLAGGGAHEAALYVLGRQRWVVISRWGSLVVLAVGDLLLIPRYSVAGALLSVGLAQLAAEVFLLVLARRAVAKAYPISFLLRVLAALAPALLVTTLWRPTSFVGLVVAGLVYAAVFLAFLRVIRPLEAEDGVLLKEVTTPLRMILSPFVAPGRGFPAALDVPPTTPTVSPVQPLPTQPLAQESRPERS